jgi:MFS family permease
MAVHAPWVMIPLRAVHGFLGGMLVGVAFAVIARTKSPDRVFGVLLFVQFGLGGLGVMTLPRLVPVYGTGVLFLALIAFSLVTLAMLPFLGPYPPRPPAARGSDMTSTGSTPRFILALLAIFLFQASNMGLFAYIIELGSAAGLPRDFISTSVGAATWVGVAGCLLVIALGTRYGRAWPLAIALAATLAGIWVLHYSGNEIVFVLANCLTGITWSLVMPYLLGLASAFDLGGRAAALGGFASKMGLASGPLVGAMFLRGDDYGLLINLSCVGIIACAAATLVPARAVDRAQESERHDAGSRAI